MEPNGSNRSQIPVYALIAMILGVGGIYYFREPLKTFRPTQPPIVEPPPVAKEVPARLWQDPLLAVRKALKERNETPQTDTTEDLSKEIKKALKEKEGILLLPVMIPGGYSADEHESRLRCRYAVLAALNSGGYTSVLWNQINWVSWFCSLDETGYECVIPYEWYEPSALHAGTPGRKGERFDRILVLWLQDNKFSEKPVERLVCLVKDLGAVAGAKAAVRILGPTHSDGLRAMYEDLARSEVQKAIESLSDCRIYSAWATVEESVLFQGKADKKYKGDIVVRTIASDRELVCKLILELEHRGVDLVDLTEEEIKENRFAIISEWDTFYGRALPLTFAAALQTDWCKKKDESVLQTGRCKEKAESEWRNTLDSLTQDSRKWPANMYRATYLLGLDGKVTSQEEGDVVENGVLKTEADNIREMERPEGSSQLDYLRRMADKLQLEAGRKLKAIGILGSDVYDKLLVLQALRGSFPHAIFFTTDLDARLLHPSQTSWARNLIVASSFGLDPGEPKKGGQGKTEETESSFQQELPPFRDTYQTSLYVAALEALECLTEGQRSGLTEAKVYEVGRTRAHLLLDERERDLLDALRPWFLPAGLVLGLWLCICYLRLGGDFFQERSKLIPVLPYLVFFIMIGLVGIVIRQFVKGAPEPFAWFEGISIWPSEILRLTAALLALHFLVKAHRRIAKGNKDLSSDFHLPPGAPPNECVFPSLKWLAHKWSVFSFPFIRAKGAFDVSSFWESYLWKGQPGNRWLRVICLSVLYGLAGSTIIQSHGRPIIPFRGDASHFIDTGVLILSVSLLVVLIFYVIDVTLLCERFIKDLCDNPELKWPPGLMEAWKNEHGEAEGFPAELFVVQLVARRTEVVSSLVMYPFIVLLLMILSRVSLFDRWDWPLGLVVVLGLNSLCALFSAVVLWRSANQARHSILQNLKQRVFISQVKEPRAERLSLVIREIESLRQGAFAPLSEQPVLRAFLIPFGGIGSAFLLELFATGF